MTPDQLCLRWEQRRTRFRPAGERIRPSEYEVASLPSDTVAKRFVLEHHYSGSYPAARRRFGLFRHGVLVGVAVFSQPMQPASVACLAGDALELGRFVLLDEVPGNGETWFLARTFAQLRQEPFAGVVSFLDPEPRTTAEGVTLFPGHVGTIYQAHNAVYLGRGTARTLQLLPDGRVLSARSLQKIRALERGWRYAAAALEAYGASPLNPDGEPRVAQDWLRHWLPRIARPLRHPGNHKYAWRFRTAPGRSRGRPLPVSLPYPRREPSLAA